MGKEYSISRSGEMGAIVGYNETGFYLLKVRKERSF